MEQISLWETPFKIRIRLESSDSKVKATVEDLPSLRSVTSWVIGITEKKYSSLLKVSQTFIQRFIFIDPKSLKIAYCGGLQGGGCGASKATELPQNIVDLYRVAFENNQEEFLENQIFFVEIGKKLRDQMRKGTIESEDLANFERISPYSCNAPIVIVEFLLENFNSNGFSSNRYHVDNRASIAILARKFLMAEISLNQGRTILNVESKKYFMKVLNESYTQNSSNSKVNTELTFKLQVIAMKSLVSKAKNSVQWWCTAIKICEQLLKAALNLLEENPIPY